MAISESISIDKPERFSPQERGKWFYDRIKLAVESINPRARYMSSEIHVPTIGDHLCVGANPDTQGVRYDRTAELYASSDDSGVTIGINRMRNERGQEKQTGLLIVRDGEVGQAVDETHSGFLVHIDAEGNAQLSALDTGMETALPQTTQLDAVDFASGTILPLEKRSRT